MTFAVDVRYAITVIDENGNEYKPDNNPDATGFRANDAVVSGYAYSPVETGNADQHTDAFPPNYSAQAQAQASYTGGTYLSKMETSNSYGAGPYPPIFPADPDNPTDARMYGYLEGHGPDGPGHEGYLVQNAEDTATLAIRGFNGSVILQIDVLYNCQYSLLQGSDNPFTRADWNAGFYVSTGDVNQYLPIVSYSAYSKSALGDIADPLYPQVGSMNLDLYIQGPGSDYNYVPIYVSFFMKQEGYTCDPSAVPIPPSAILLGTGLVGL
ncbi:MAG: hypothetical protein P8168_10405 [Deltaproteobacteria bacterium]